MSLPDIFLTSVDSDTVITDEIPLIIACRDNELEEDYHINPIVFIECNPDIYMDSLTCRKMAKIMTKGDILNAYDGKNMINVEIIKKLQIVIYMREPKEYFTIEHINHAVEFYYYIKFADKYMLNIELICSKMENIIWLLMIKERQKDLWRANSILLKNIEQKIFDKPKFGVVAQQPPAAYPVGNVKKSVPKYVTMSEIKQNKIMSDELLTDLIYTLSNSGAIDFISKLVIILGSSIEYCDKIFTSPEIIEQVYNLPVFLPSMYYALRVMYLEELSMLNRKRGPGRFIIDISAASMLPFVSAEYFNSPYFVTTVVVKYENNLTLPANYMNSRGIYSMDEFNHRLSIFTKDAFKNIKWGSDNYQTALSGSIITACAVKSPFEEKFRSIECYFNEYYPCRKSNYAQNIQNAKNKQNKQNTLYTECSDSDSESSETDIKEESEEIEKKIDYSDMDLMIACDWEIFDKIAYQHYQSIKNTVKYEISMEKVITENKHKYIIKGMHRDIDIFHVNDIPSVIVKYHLGCVRAWYDGKTVSCFPSFITAAFTGINMDLRWVSNKKDVRDVVLKYFQRGFGTLINLTDKKDLINYVNQSDLWPSIRTTTGTWTDRIYKERPLFHDNHQKMFNPSISKLGIHKHLDTIPSKICISLETESDDNGAIINDYRDLKGKKIILPGNCKSLASYL